MKHLCHYICLISYTNILQSYDYLVLPFIHCYLLFVAFSDKIYAPVSFKIVLKAECIFDFNFLHFHRKTSPNGLCDVQMCRPGQL